MTIKNLIIWAKFKLKKTNFGIIEINYFLSKILNKNNIYIMVHSNDKVSLKKILLFKYYILKLKRNIPFEYISGEKEWMKLYFKVSKNTFIPREDTKILLKAILFFRKNKKKINIAEIGTGSGILPILINKKWSEANLYTVEKYKKTINVAKENFKEYNTKVKIFLGDFLKPLINNNIKVSILFSNPPYISKKEYEKLDLSVKKEPKTALIGGEDGLYFYKKFAKEYKKVLKKNGYLIFEIGYNQKKNIEKIFKNTELKIIKVLKDKSGIERVIVLKREKV